jgi:cell division protein FtsB
MKFLKIFSFAVFSLSFLNSVAAYTDISPEDPDRSIFEHLRDVKIMNPLADGLFHGENIVSRAEALAVALRAGDISVPTEFDPTKIPFSDIDPNEWYAPVVTRAVELKLIDRSGDSFRPNEPITKAEFLTFLFRCTHVNLTSQGYVKDIAKDVPNDAWFAPYFSYAKKYQIAFLPADEMYHPEKVLTRREIAIMTYRRLKIFHGNATTADFVEMQAKIQQFITLLHAGESEKAEAQLQRILELSKKLMLQQSDESTVAAAAIGRSMKHLAESLRAFKFGRMLSGIESLFLATNQAQRAEQKSEKIAPFAREILNLIDETLQSYLFPREDQL